jgi:radical SAM superfamily enzyme YgiQ (UPF0313 family)
MGFKVLLIKPNITVRKGFDLQNKIYPPLGLAYLSGSLLEKGYEVRIMDMVAENPHKVWDYRGTHNCFGATDSDMIERIKEYAPDVVGITGVTIQYSRMEDMVAAIKASFPDIKVVLGGIHATSMPELVMSKTQADYIIQGEGERTFAALLDALRDGRGDDIGNIDGIVYRREGDIVVKPKLYSSEDLDNIPLPARHLLPNDVYRANNVPMPIITSRGCPHNCAFCCIRLAQGRKWRARNPVKVVDEIEMIVKGWGYEAIAVFDDAFNVLPERVIDICREIVRRKLHIHLVVPSSLIIRYITKDTLYWLKEAGCVSVALPFEHADETMRNKVIRKGLSTEQFDNVLLWCMELELLSIVNFVVGMPGESERSLQVLNEYVRNNAFKMDALSVYIATPFPGTEFYNECIAGNYLVNPGRNNFIDYDFYECLIDTPQLRHEQVNTYKKIIEDTFNEARGERLSHPYVRKAIRRPDKESLAYVKDIYFREKKLLWEKKRV